jgi:hypothetical protein
MIMVMGLPSLSLALTRYDPGTTRTSLKPCAVSFCWISRGSATAHRRRRVRTLKTGERFSKDTLNTILNKTGQSPGYPLSFSSLGAKDQSPCSRTESKPTGDRSTRRCILSRPNRQKGSGKCGNPCRCRCGRCSGGAGAGAVGLAESAETPPAPAQSAPGYRKIVSGNCGKCGNCQNRAARCPRPTTDQAVRVFAVSLGGCTPVNAASMAARIAGASRRPQARASSGVEIRSWRTSSEQCGSARGRA